MFFTFWSDINNFINNSLFDSGYNFNKYPYNDKPFCYARHRTKSSLRIRIEELEKSKQRILDDLYNSFSHKQKEFRLHLVKGIDKRIKRNCVCLKKYDLVRLRAFTKAFI